MTLQEIDPLTYSTILELQLQDSEELAGRAKGKHREGTVSDSELALQLYTENLKDVGAVLQDRKMAQSFAAAVESDGWLVQEAHLQEQQVAIDRGLAQRMSIGNEPPVPEEVDTHEFDFWNDTEMLDKVAALYGQQAQRPVMSSASMGGESNERYTARAPVAESSAWAASRKTQDRPLKGHCVACGDEKEFFEVVQVPCEYRHEYCHQCLADLFRLSMKDESLFPPRCDGEVISFERIRFFLPPKLAREFEAKAAELRSTNRLYCHERACSKFLPQSDISGDVGTCSKCRRTTCVMCKAASHTGDCPEDTSLRELLSTAEAQQWQRCYQCHSVVELDTGCNHIL